MTKTDCPRSVLEGKPIVVIEIGYAASSSKEDLNSDYLKLISNGCDWATRYVAAEASVDYKSNSIDQEPEGPIKPMVHGQTSVGKNAGRSGSSARFS